MSENRVAQLLGQIKHGSCRPRAILFKVLADTVGLESRLMVVRFTFTFLLRPLFVVLGGGEGVVAVVCCFKLFTHVCLLKLLPI